MSFVRAGRFGHGRTDPLAKALDMQVEERRATRSGVVCSGTLACPRCDAPVAAGERGLRLTEELACPFCAHRNVRVVVRVVLPGA